MDWASALKYVKATSRSIVKPWQRSAIPAWSMNVLLPT